MGREITYCPRELAGKRVYALASASAQAAAEAQAHWKL